MIIADGSKRFCRTFHGVAAPGAVHMKIDKAGCEIISVKIKNLTCVCLDTLADCGDFSFFDNELQAVTNAIRKNQTRIGENHFASKCTKCGADPRSQRVIPSYLPSLFLFLLLLVLFSFTFRRFSSRYLACSSKTRTSEFSRISPNSINKILTNILL